MMLVDGLDIFWFSLGSMLIYLCMSQSFPVAKSCGGGCKKLATCGRNGSITSVVFSVVMLAMYLSFLSHMLDSQACMYMVGMFVRMHSPMDVMRFVSFRGGSMYLLSFVWVWLR